MQSMGRRDAPARGGSGPGRVLLFRGRDEQRGGAAATVEQAVAAGRVVAIDYVDRDGAASEREVEPAGLVRGLDGWYLVGRCRLRGAGRAFRLDRVAWAREVDEPVPVPAPAVQGLEPDVPVRLRRPVPGADRLEVVPET
ncbi:MAG: helix-turn-helix transcriptional regulator [Frankiaceae bacterium]